MAELLAVDDALSRIVETAEPLAAESVAVAAAAGRVLREPARALVDLPPFPSSAMDGFAVRAADVPGELPVAFEIPAGSPPPGPLPLGAAAAISTGGTVPDGADAVVPVELVEVRGAHVAIAGHATDGQHVRPRGGDVRGGDVVVDVGTSLGPAQIGALAASGIAEVTCSALPRVAVLATGSELRPAGEPLAAGQIYESNRAMLAATLGRMGADVDVLPVVEDDEAAHRAAIARGLEADVLVSSGGVSMGEHDLVRRVASELGVREIFWGVAVKPGKPLSFGARDGALVFGLPGNPVSSLVGALVFVATGLRALQGAADARPRYALGLTATALRRNLHRDEFVRAVRVDDGDGVLLRPIAGQESHMIVRAAVADSLVHVPRGDGEIPAGSLARFLALD
ncbi:MAG TPA: gephyrin-like molybdotransferase Glp [Gaiellaceae bacterium]|nr:gephyrin-like molybdotransferase Glp [Gaiellaceae bacterium]